jgi:hypothetical protein
MGSVCCVRGKPRMITFKEFQPKLWEEQNHQGLGVVELAGQRYAVSPGTPWLALPAKTAMV